MKLGGPVKLADHRCPICAKLLDGASCLNAEGQTHTPKEGDFSICIGCSAVLRFNADLSLRNVGPDEIKLLNAEQRQALGVLQHFSRWKAHD